MVPARRSGAFASRDFCVRGAFRGMHSYLHASAFQQNTPTAANENLNAHTRKRTRTRTHAHTQNLALDAGYNVLLQSPCAHWHEPPWPHLDDKHAARKGNGKGKGDTDADADADFSALLEGGADAQFDVVLMDAGERRAAYAPFHGGSDAFVFMRANSWTNW